MRLVIHHDRDKQAVRPTLSTRRVISIVERRVSGRFPGSCIAATEQIAVELFGMLKIYGLRLRRLFEIGWSLQGSCELARAFAIFLYVCTEYGVWYPQSSIDAKRAEVEWGSSTFRVCTLCRALSRVRCADEGGVLVHTLEPGDVRAMSTFRALIGGNLLVVIEAVFLQPRRSDSEMMDARKYCQNEGGVVHSPPAYCSGEKFVPPGRYASMEFFKTFTWGSSDRRSARLAGSAIGCALLSSMPQVCTGTQARDGQVWHMHTCMPTASKVQSPAARRPSTPRNKRWEIYRVHNALARSIPSSDLLAHAVTNRWAQSTPPSSAAAMTDGAKVQQLLALMPVSAVRTACCTMDRSCHTDRYQH